MQRPRLAALPSAGHYSTGPSQVHKYVNPDPSGIKALPAHDVSYRLSCFGSSDHHEVPVSQVAAFD